MESDGLNTNKDNLVTTFSAKGFVYALLVCLPIVGGGAWLCTGTSIWWIGTVIVSLFWLLILWSSISIFVKEHKIDVLFVLFCTVLLGTWYFIGMHYSRTKAEVKPLTKVYLDNFSSYDVCLDLNGKPWQTIYANSTKEDKLPVGKHDLIIRSLDRKKELDSLAIEVRVGKTHVLNILGRMKYYVGTAHYVPPSKTSLYESSSHYLGIKSNEIEILDKWFRVDCEYIFETSPSYLEVSRPEGLTTRRKYLRRGELTK